MSTSILQRAMGNMLDRQFPQFHIRENYRPDWLISSDNTKLELDFFIEELGVAFEVQGKQHYEYVPLFHGDYSGFEKRLRFDQEKRDLCDGHGVKLVEIFTETDAIVAVRNIQDSLPAINPPTYSYAEDSTESVKAAAEQIYKVRRDKASKEERKKIEHRERQERIAALRKAEEQETILRTPMKADLIVWCEVALRRMKKGEPMVFDYAPHYTEMAPDILELIKGAVAACHSPDNVRALFENLKVIFG